MLKDILKALPAVLACGLALSCSGPSERSSSSRPLPKGIVDDRASASSSTDDYSAIIAKYGKPERDDSTEYDTPRPPIVTRFVEYRPENVKIAFVPVGKFGEPPPYNGWKVIGYIDIESNTKMSSGEATERLARRIRR
jgi:hypothetical protein